MTAAQDIPRDPDGFLADPGSWSPALAAALAAAEGLGELGPEHWRVIDVIRAHWTEKGAAPMIRVLCRESGLSLGRIYELFPQGPANGACKVAGLPKPDGCV
jgi:tRNA 2-thiouridine synthesizing protein E